MDETTEEIERRFPAEKLITCMFCATGVVLIRRGYIGVGGEPHFYYVEEGQDDGTGNHPCEWTLNRPDTFEAVNEPLAPGQIERWKKPVKKPKVILLKETEV